METSKENREVSFDTVSECKFYLSIADSQKGYKKKMSIENQKRVWYDKK